MLSPANWFFSCLTEFVINWTIIKVLLLFMFDRYFDIKCIIVIYKKGFKDQYLMLQSSVTADWLWFCQTTCYLYVLWPWGLWQCFFTFHVKPSTEEDFSCNSVHSWVFVSCRIKPSMGYPSPFFFSFFLFFFSFLPSPFPFSSSLPLLHVFSILDFLIHLCSLSLWYNIFCQIWAMSLLPHTCQSSFLLIWLHLFELWNDSQTFPLPYVVIVSFDFVCILQKVFSPTTTEP